MTRPKRAGDNLPYWKRYVKDYLTDTLDLSLEEDGAYNRLLDYQWLHGGVPDDATALAGVMRTTTAKARRIWAKLAPKFPLAGPVGRMNNRMEEERALAIAKSRKAANAGAESQRVQNERRANVGTDVGTDAGTSVGTRGSTTGHIVQSTEVRTNSLSEDRKPGTAEPIGAILHRIAKGAA